jgi:hypothetical protein
MDGMTIDDLTGAANMAGFRATASFRPGKACQIGDNKDAGDDVIGFVFTCDLFVRSVQVFRTW